MVSMQLEAERAAHDLVAQIPGGTGFFQGRFKAFVDLEDLAVDVVVADRDAHRVGGDGHAFDDLVRVVHQDLTVLAGTGLAFVGVADEVFLARELAGHEAPLQAGRETGAAAAAQRGGLDLGDDLVGRQTFAAVLAEDLAQGRIAAAGLVVLDRPVLAVQIGIDLRADVTPVETGLGARTLKLGEVQHACPQALAASARNTSMSSSRRSLLMKLHIWRSLTSITGESAQAPRHSLFCTVNRPSAVVPPWAMPSL
mmetsp:Transcript_33923/g.55363  ORF Transcript_33923/g.55363 Transcript_33923/m.55363 type:complete len:254 (-) Transcript_33923:192-953(-)